MTTGDTYAERAARGARTQSMFRDVNERVKEINDAFSDYVPLGDWICECADQACSERIELTPAEYEKVRAHPARFAVAPRNQHLFEEIEAVVEETARYWVVEKTGSAAKIAELVDPRTVGLRGSARATAPA